ncbi:hypothetical protein IQ06DRAFT_13804 [Phaeosphaeriaceae sp. SRC1lsM3a]|nr:hypothetical protein IQ06DRAFT_13804 [Stagonospora sp. SRC1lsM3a]
MKHLQLTPSQFLMQHHAKLVPLELSSQSCLPERAASTGIKWSNTFCSSPRRAYPNLLRRGPIVIAVCIAFGQHVAKGAI